MSLGEYAPLSERKRPCVPRPALFALFGALLWAIVGLTATLATLSAAEVEVTAVEAIVPPGRCDHAQVVGCDAEKKRPTAPVLAPLSLRSAVEMFDGVCVTDEQMRVGADAAAAAAASEAAAAAKAIRDDVTAGVIGYLQLEVQLDDLYE